MSVRWSSRPVPALLAVLAIVLSMLAISGPAHAAGFVETDVDNPVSAAPPLSRPATRHCTVTLARDFPSNSATGAAQDYTGTLTPPAACRGPWVKVVLDQRISVAGRQFDRSASLSIGGVQVYFGTTEEPSAAGISYHVEHDLTAYTSLLRTARPFDGGIVNYTDATYTGVYRQTVTVTYYTADRQHPAPVTPDRVVGTTMVDVNATNDTAHFALSDLPRNITHAYLGVTVKGNGCDEQWFTAVPSDLAAKENLCGGGPYREVQSSLDGTPVGVTQFFPYIYSGGIVPTLWRPLPAIGTNDLTPETLDVTPFAGRLVDGGSHDLAVRVLGASDTWNVDATLFLYTDRHLAQTRGGLISSSVDTSPDVRTTETPIEGGTRVDVSTSRSDRTVGWMQTSAGRVVTTVTGRAAFHQTDDVTASGLTQVVHQTDSGAQSTLSTCGGRIVRSGTRLFSYPIDIVEKVANYTDDQNFSLQGQVTMARALAVTGAGGDGSRGPGSPALGSVERVASTGVLSRTAGTTSEADGRASASYLGTDDAARFYAHVLRADHGRITYDSRG